MYPGRGGSRGLGRFALTSTACQPPAQEAGPLSDEDVEVIRAVPHSYAEAVLASDWAAVASHCTEDALRLPPNALLIEGRAAIQAAYEGLPRTFTEFFSTLRFRDLATVGPTPAGSWVVTSGLGARLKYRQ